MKKFIDEFLNLSDKVNYRSDMTVDDVLHYLHIDKSEYYNCLSVASGVDYEIHLKRPLNSCFINPSFSKPFGTHIFYQWGVELTPQLSQKPLPA